MSNLLTLPDLSQDKSGFLMRIYTKLRFFDILKKLSIK